MVRGGNPAEASGASEGLGALKVGFGELASVSASASIDSGDVAAGFCVSQKKEVHPRLCQTGFNDVLGLVSSGGLRSQHPAIISTPLHEKR